MSHEDRSLADAFDRRWASAGPRVAIRQDGGDLSFGNLLHWSNRLSRTLEAVVREPGQRVALMMGNSAAFVAAFFAIARIGGVVAPLHPGYRAQELRHYLADLEAAAILVEANSLARTLKLPEGEIRPAVIEVSRASGARVIRPGRGRAQALRYGASPPLLQQYTSGSTGLPKRVARTHANLLAEVDALQDGFGVTGGERFAGAAPFCHVNGLVRTMMTAMYVGATLYPIDAFHRRRILDLLTLERITVFGGVPQMFVILGQTPPRGHVDLSALRLVFSASAPLLAVDNRRFYARYGIFVRQLYGSTETGTISFNRHPAPESCPLSVGTPVRGVRVEVLDDLGTPLPPDQEGELAVASPFAIVEYLGNSAATAESFRQGLYVTGDVGFKDDAGYITITGRKQLFINRGGFKVNPYEVEATIKEHPRVVDAVVLGIPGAHGDETVAAVIVRSQACKVEEIVLHCRDRIADFKIPTRIEFRESLPKSPTGKFLRAELRREIMTALHVDDGLRTDRAV